MVASEIGARCVYSDGWVSFTLVQVQCASLLVIHGALSDILSHDVAEQMTDPAKAPLITGKRFVMHVDGVGHAPGLVDAEQMDRITTFMTAE